MDKECRILGQRCPKCERTYEVKTVEVTNTKFWLTFGVCDYCEIVIGLGMTDHEPIRNVDYIFTDDVLSENLKTHQEVVKEIEAKNKIVKGAKRENRKNSPKGKRHR